MSESIKTKMELDPKKVVEVYERYEAVGDQFLLVRNQVLLVEYSHLLFDWLQITTHGSFFVK